MRYTASPYIGQICVISIGREHVLPDQNNTLRLPIMDLAFRPCCPIIEAPTLNVSICRLRPDIERRLCENHRTGCDDPFETVT